MIVVLNYGGQFAHLIARRVRDLGVKAEILHGDAPLSEIKALNPVGIILSGSGHSVLNGGPMPDKGIFEMGIPVLGICYGLQLMAHMLGGEVKGGYIKEYGKETLDILKKDKLFKKLSSKEVVWFSHGDQATKLPTGFIKTASSKSCELSGFADEKRGFYGIQFHPEVTHTVRGIDILSNFVFEIAKAKKNWSLKDVSADIVDELKEKIGTDHVVVGISGGVDSLVAATLLHKAIGDQLHAVFVDHGLLRKGEVESVSAALKSRGFNQLHVIDASEMFLSRLKGVTDPEEKRKIIGHAFVEVFEKALGEELQKYPVKYLAQGTIYPDRIESAAVGKHADKIKSHHNLTLPEKMKLGVIEPLKDLYKDEVRRVGEGLGIPHDMVWRHPFPGPGLGIRIVGEITPERLNILREADAVYQEELKAAGEYEKIWQAFAALLPLKSVGVMGDERTYEYMIALRAVDSIDGMSADWHKIPPELLERISSRIVNSVRGVNRVLYDITQKPPATIEYE
jgi:GMP synthase (glutamine-hydrolysing)